MNKKLLLLLLFLSINSFSQNEKSEVTDFYKTIIKTYFDKDCDKLYTTINDSVTLIGSDGKFFSSKKMIESRKVCNRFEKYTTNLISFDNYIENYKINVLSKKEFIADNNKSNKKLNTEKASVFEVLEYLKMYKNSFTENDYLVFGKLHKKVSTKNILTGPFLYIVRKTNAGWKIVGMER